MIWMSVEKACLQSSASAVRLCCIPGVGNHCGNNEKSKIQQHECHSDDPALTSKCKNNRKGKNEA